MQHSLGELIEALEVPATFGYWLFGAAFQDGGSIPRWRSTRTATLCNAG
jgi:hypothetical protein